MKEKKALSKTALGSSQQRNHTGSDDRGKAKAKPAKASNVSAIRKQKEPDVRGMVEKPAKWEKSEGKKRLKKELWDANSRFHNMSTKEIHASDRCFSVYPLKNFTTNLRNLKKKIEATKAHVEFDNKAVAEQKRLFPRKPNTKRGYPHCFGRPAKEDLEDDVRDGTAEKMWPRKLRMTRLSYQEFPSDVFCKRVHAEKRKQREAAFWVDKRNKKAMKKHLKEVAEMKKKHKI